MKYSFILLAGASIAGLTAEQALAAPRTFNIPSQSMAAALQQFALQSGEQIVFTPEVSAGKQSNDISGSLEPEVALGRLLEGSSLVYRRAKGAYVIKAAPSRKPVAAEPKPLSQQPGGDVEAAGVEEIVVTAQKREQNVQSVPIAISALSQRFVAERDITSIDKLSAVAPGLKIERNGPSSTNSTIAIRGAVTSNPALFYEPSVGIYVDGVYIPKAMGSVFEMSDIQRIEVLRGPQGTLYGRNTLAGAINIITGKPKGELGGEVEATYGNYDFRRVRARLDLPTIGIFSVRLSGQIQKRDGFVKITDAPPVAATVGPRLVDELRTADSKVGGVVVRAEPMDGLSFDYRFDISDIDQLPPPSQLVGFSKGGIFDPSAPAYNAPGVGGATFPIDKFLEPRERRDRLYSDSAAIEKVKNWGHALTATLDLQEIGELKSITAYRKIAYTDQLDLDGTPLPVAHTFRQAHYRSFSQELQLTGEVGRLSYVVGAFYFDDKGDSDNPQSYFGGRVRTDSRYGFGTKSYAGYGQLDFDLTDQLTLTGGLRYTHEKKTIERQLRSFVTGVVTIDAPAGSIAPVTFSSLSPTVILSYEMNRQLNVYAKYAQGYRSGGFNGEATTLAEVQIPFEPEVVDAFELGLKSRLLDDRLQLNISAFWNENKDKQLVVFRGGASAASNIINAGKARIRGLEIEASARPGDNLSVRAGFAYLAPKYKQFLERGVNVADNRSFPHAPKYTISTGMDWTAAEWGDVKLNFIGDLNFVSSYFTGAAALRPVGNEVSAYNGRSPGRVIVDGRAVLSNLPIGVTTAKLSVWGRNLLNEDKPNFIIDFGPSFGGMTEAYFPEPRTYGVTLGVNF